MSFLSELNKIQVIGLIMIGVFTTMFIIELYNFIYSYGVNNAPVSMTDDQVKKWKWGMYISLGLMILFITIGIVGFQSTDGDSKKTKSLFAGLTTIGFGFAIYLFKNFFEISLMTQSDKTELIGTDTIRLIVLFSLMVVGWVLLIFPSSDLSHVYPTV